MKASFYEKLQHDFALMRSLKDNESLDQEKYNTALSSIQDARAKIRHHAAPMEKKVLLYCIDTLFDILKENDAQKLFDFADAVHNIPEIYLQKRNLYSFRKVLKSFQKRYGKEYFPFIDEVKPHFSKKAPKNKWEYFSASSDEDFKRLHPKGYGVLVAIGCTVLLLPQIIYVAYAVFINPASNEWPILLGYVGTFLVGIGLFNIVSAWIHQYLGHLLTAVCLIGGTALTLFSLFLLYL